MADGGWGRVHGKAWGGYGGCVRVRERGSKGWGGGAECTGVPKGAKVGLREGVQGKGKDTEGGG